jgi:flagellar biosynthesis protein FlhA
MASTPATSQNLELRSLLGSKDAFMAVTLVLIIGIMLVPLPAVFLDLLVVLNMALSIGVILLTMYITQPMDFSAFPSMLLLITLFRLGLNISSSRQILLQGQAGKMIETFGTMVVGNNYIVGVVVFLMLMVIQFVVITNGAGRVAEVAARFTLDAMPGKQLAIDADLNAGLIDEGQARARRHAIEVEADFYGAMDGASKFVRGDAIAAVIVMLVNIFGGFAIGMFQRGLPLVDALQSYTLLTVGAGLAIQVPALIVSSAAGLIVTRNSSEKSLGNDMIGQLANYNVLLVGTAILGAFTLIPGLPKLPFLLIGAVTGGAAYSLRRRQQKPVEETARPAEIEPETPQEMLELLVIDPIELEIGYGLVSLIDNEQSDNLLKRITSIRRQIMNDLGLVLPIVRVRDNLRLQPQAYRMKIRGEEVARGELILDRFLAIPSSEPDGKIQGTPTVEPAFGLPALWIGESEKGRAEMMDYTVVNPLSVLSTHLLEVARRYAPDLLTRQTVHEMLDQLRSKTPAAIEGVVPEMLSLGEVQAVLRNLLEERVPVRDLPGILEVLANHAPVTRDPSILAEAVRHTLARTLSNLYRDDKDCLHVFTLSPSLEARLRESLGNTDGGLGFQIEATFAQTILARTGEQMERLAQLGHMPIFLCPRELRLAYRRLVAQTFPNLVVLAFSEVSPGTKVKAHCTVDVP